MPEVIFQGNGTDEAFHVLVNPNQNCVQRWGSVQVGNVFSPKCKDQNIFITMQNEESC